MFDSLTLTNLSAKFLIGALFFIRVTGIFASAPFFRNAAIPIPVKLFFGVIITIMITSIFGDNQPPIDFHLWNLALLAFKEFIVGAIIGFVMDMVFQAARYAGGLIDFEMGFQTATLFSMESTTPTMIGELKSMIILMIFLILDGHHFLIESLFISVKAVPITYFEQSESTLILLAQSMTSVFIVAAKMAAPVLVSLFLTNLSLALLARVAPQTNIFVLSFTAKIVVGLLVLMASVPLFVLAAKSSMQIFQDQTLKILMSLNPGRV